MVIASLLVTLLLFLKTTTCEVYYIKSDSVNSTDQKCLTHPCLTLNDFIVQTQWNLSNNNVTSLMFLPGNHSLDMDLNIGLTEKVFISSHVNTSWIICGYPKRFQFLKNTLV